MFPSDRHERLAQHMLADGMPIILDEEKSRGNVFVDKATGDEYLDTFSYFASGALGHNHEVFFSETVEKELLQAARTKVTLSDIYTDSYVEFVEKISTITPASYIHHFFIEGGALAVENALKAAFDWKIKKNAQKGVSNKGSQILHFKEAFHGRSGYTLSLTNTNSKIKTEGFPQFDWPRVSSPAMSFPCEGQNLEETISRERESLNQIKDAFAKNKDDIAAIIIEPIQSEGGDRHFRREFLKSLRDLAFEEEALLVFDEVQTGLALSGRWWCHEHFSVEPDIFTFAKKMQVGGLAATKRLDEVDSVFQVSSRINSTFGGNLTDMVRAKWIVNTIERENLVAHADQMGARILKELQTWASPYGDLINNIRGRGLMVAFDLNSEVERDRFWSMCFEEKLLVLPCGERSIRMRPFLTFDEDALGILTDRLGRVTQQFKK